MINKCLFLIINAQYDYCDKDGAMHVPAAGKDMERLTSFKGWNPDEPEIVRNTVIRKNCMSPVHGFEHRADNIFAQLKPHQLIEV
ncbi:MAG: hypothetical protein LBH60_05880 [Prevotellaceae bacterium]|jgi:hypothetical protein|nr:hypothetical protein [Prevotellaceae bacterium]